MQTFSANILANQTPEILNPKGELFGVTIEIYQNGTCLLKHPHFQNGSAFAFPVLIERHDAEATITASVGGGLIAVECFNRDGSQNVDFLFQVLIIVYP